MVEERGDASSDVESRAHSFVKVQSLAHMGKKQKVRSEVEIKVASQMAGATHEQRIARDACRPIFVHY